MATIIHDRTADFKRWDCGTEMLILYTNYRNLFFTIAKK